MTYNDKMDEVEFEMAKGTPVFCRVHHEFYGGCYMRLIFMPKGTGITSMIHKTEHPFFIFTGKVKVLDEQNGIQILEAPYSGITKPGTRRLLEILEDCAWMTVHKTDVVPKSNGQLDIDEAVDKVCDEIIEKRENPLLGGFIRNNTITELIDN